MRSAWGVDTLALAWTTRPARRAGEREGAEAEGEWTPRLPDTRAEKEWVAPASAGEARSVRRRAGVCRRAGEERRGGARGAASTARMRHGLPPTAMDFLLGRFPREVRPEVGERWGWGGG